MSDQRSSVPLVAAGTYTPAAAASQETGSNKPALNPAAFRRGWAKAAPNERVGMTVTGTYFKTGLLLALIWTYIPILRLLAILRR